MLIKVTQENIDNGRPRDPEYCPIALAIRGQCPDPPNGFKVMRTNVRWRGDSFQLPSEAMQFIDDFDIGMEVSPFEFELEGFEC